MNKLTKLLSVFVIAGAVSAGVATLAGCGHKHEVEKHDAVAATCTTVGYSSDYYTCSAPECAGKYYSDEACTKEIDLATITIAATGHSATKHDAKAATCTEVGYSSAYYTCSGTECAGKYYSDEACTTAISIATITIDATGHTEVFTDKGDGTHGITCEHNDLTETTEAHADADNDGKCDKCKALFFAPGKFYNMYYGTETLIEIKAGGKVVFSENEYALSAITEDETTHALSATFTVNNGSSDVEYTLTKTETGYKLSYLYYGYEMAKDLIPVPATYAEALEDFAGVYSLGAEYKYTSGGDYYKLNAISLTEDGKVIYTAIKVNEDGSAIDGAKAVTRIEDVSSSAVKYNKFSASSMTFTATSANCATVEFVFGYDDTNVVTLTKTADAAPVVPADMGLTAFTQYANADESYSLLVKEEGAFSLNGSYSTKLISGNATDGYLIQTTDSSYEYVNFVLKINATDNTVDLYDAAGTTKIDTLSVKVQNIPTLAVSDITASEPTLNTSPLVDVFNSSYAYYKIATAGWYYFGSGDTQNITIYTKVADHEVDVTQGVVKVYAGFASKGVQLAAGDIIAVSAYGDYSIIAVVESTNKDDVYVTEFEGFTAEQYGTYTGEYEKWGSPATLEIEISASGITYDGYTANVIAYNGDDYLVEVYGYAIKFSFNNDGNIVVEYDNWNDTENCTAVKGGTSGGEEGGEETVTEIENGGNLVLGSNEITSYESCAATVYLTVSDTLPAGKYKLEFNYLYFNTLKINNVAMENVGAKYTYNIELKAGDSIPVSFEYGDSYVTVSVSVAEEEAIVGKNTVQAGKSGSAEITFNVPGTYTLTYDSDADNVYYIMVGGAMVFSGKNFTVTDSVTIVVYANDNSTTSSFTIAVAEESGEEGGETESGLKLGENTISEFDSVFWTATVTFTATEAGTYTFDFVNVYASSTVSTINGTALELDSYTGAATHTLTLEANQTITIIVEQNMSYDDIIITITKA
ncbi:MAG: hypothetical protein ACI4MB_01040 [Candidatus Coproplasma sp.]